MTYTFAVIDGCEAAKGELFSVEATDEDQACEIFVKKAIPILPDSFDYESFVRMLKEEDIDVVFLGNVSTPIQL